MLSEPTLIEGGGGGHCAKIFSRIVGVGPDLLFSARFMFTLVKRNVGMF